MKKIYYPLLFLLITVLFFSCGKREGNEEMEKKPPKLAVVKPIDTSEVNRIDSANLKLYIENTASMDGYIVGYTGFKDVLAQLINETSELNTRRFSTELYLINENIIPLKIPNRITTDLNKNTVKNQKGRGNSDFEKIIEKILNEHKANDISVLAADFIYSPKDGHTQKRLTEFQEFTKKAFLDADIKSNNTEVLFLRFNSEYNDVYYDIDNKEIPDLKTRPYYLMILANQQLMTEFNENISPKLMNISDFENSVYFDNKSTEAYPLDDFSILTSTLNSSPLKANHIENNKIKSISAPRNEKLQVAIALNLSNIPISNEFKMEISNYEVENYNIEKIGEIENNKIIFTETESPIIIMGADKDKLHNLTHVFLFTSTEKDIKNLKFRIKKQVPSWVNEFSNSDDRDIAQNPSIQSQTFGLEYFIKGMNDAYKRNDNSYYTALTVGIIPVSEGSGLGSLFVFILLIVIIAGIILIIKNKKSRK